MKVKLFFLTLSAVILTYFIYYSNHHQELKISTIYEEKTTSKENFNTYLKPNLEKLLPVTYYTFSKENLEIENVIDKIKNNYKDIQQELNSSNVIIVYLGEFELLYEKESIINIYTDLENLFITLRKYNSKEIIYLSPLNLNTNYILKDLSRKYKIDFFNTSSILGKTGCKTCLLEPNDQKIISQKLYDKIITTWKINT